MEDYIYEKDLLHEELHEAAIDIKDAMYVSMIYLFLPL